MGINYIIKGDNIKSDIDFVNKLNHKESFMVNLSFDVYGSEVLSEFLKDGSDVYTKVDYIDGHFKESLVKRKNLQDYNVIDIINYLKFDINQFVRNIVDIENLDYFELNSTEKEIYDTIINAYNNIKDQITDDFCLYYYLSI